MPIYKRGFSNTPSFELVELYVDDGKFKDQVGKVNH